MKASLRKYAAALTLLALLSSITACSSPQPAAASAPPESKATAAPATEKPADKTAEPAAETKAAEATSAPAAGGNDLAFQKYDPPVTITAIRTVDDTTKFLAGEDINNNVWARMYADTLGLTMKYDWTASTDQQYDDKLNVAIASNQLPDIFRVNRTQLARLAKTELINKDLQPVLDQYASPFLKEIITQEGTTALDSATFDGKLIAFPNTGSSMDGAPMIWIRQDWMDKVGQKAPTTIDELDALINDFMTKDPEGNGGPYFGVALQKDLTGGFAGYEGLANAYGAYPRTWIKNAEGRLVFGSYQPEIKVVLKKLQDWYKEGKIDTEFAVKDQGKESELCISGKIGIQFGQMWNPLWPLQATVDNNNKADWASYALPAAPGVTVKPQIGLGTSTYFVANKNCKNPEAAVKMMNVFVQKGWDGTVEDYNQFFNTTVDGTLYETFKYSFCQAWPAKKNLDTHYAVKDAFERNDTGKLNPEQSTNYETCKTYMNGDPKGWGMYRVFSKDGSFRIIDQYVTGNLLQMNAFYGADTPTMTTKSSALEKLEKETFTKIIMGENIDTFDTFVKQAMELGGKAIEDEVNAWAASNAK